MYATTSALLLLGLAAARAEDASQLLQVHGAGDSLGAEEGAAQKGTYMCSNMEPKREGVVYTANVTWEEEDLPRVTRTFHIYVPHGYQQREGNPMTMHFHGWGEDALDYHKYYGWKETADRLNVLMVYPEGMNDCQEGADCQDPQKWKSWNAGGASASTWRRMSCNPEKQIKNYCYSSCAKKKKDGCHPCDWASCYDDVAFTKKVLHYVKSNFCVDAERVYAAGCSNGGLMVHELARDIPEEFAAVASMCGGKPHEGWAYMPPEGPEMPVMLFTGRQDDTIPRSQPLADASNFDGFLFADESAVMRMYKHYNQCTNKGDLVYETGHTGKERCRIKGHNCSGTASVVECARDGGHDVWADDTLMAMNFFLDHTMHRARPRMAMKVETLEEVKAGRPLKREMHMKDGVEVSTTLAAQSTSGYW